MIKRFSCPGLDNSLFIWHNDNMKPISVSLMHLMSTLAVVWMILFTAAGCRTPEAFRQEVDTRVTDILAQKTAQVRGTKDQFTIETPGDTLRRQLLHHLSLPVAGPVSLGTGHLPRIPHWPEPGFPAPVHTPDPETVSLDGPLTVSLIQALKIGAQNSFEFQTRKEAVFQAALALYLEQDAFRNRFISQVQQLFSADLSSEPTRKGTRSSADITGTRQLETGMALSGSLAADLAALLFNRSGSSMGIAGDASLSIPLLRGSGRHIVTENLQQAEQNLVYAILEFERFKKTFAVAVASQYLNLLKQLDTVNNARDDYTRRMALTRRSQRLGEAGRLKDIEVDQAVQTQLVARQRWLSGQEALKKETDRFKGLLGLPPDADIRPDPEALRQLSDPAVLTGGHDTPGPLELSEAAAIAMALDHRLDLQIALGKVFDAQRAVVVAADALGAELTFFGSASIGERRTITTADLDNARLRMDKGVFSALLTLDLPLDRTAEAVTYRNRFIQLEQAVREVQKKEDTLKTEIRNRLRELFEARQTLFIQTQAVSLAEKRVKSITLFMEAGRAETRDLLEAQDALLSAQNNLTAARVNYRIAELEIQRDMGVLLVTDTGLWQEYSSKGTF
jgi:outer membrane protein TolC